MSCPCDEDPCEVLTNIIVQEYRLPSGMKGCKLGQVVDFRVYDNEQIPILVML